MLKMIFSIAMTLFVLSGCMMQHSGQSSKTKADTDSADDQDVNQNCFKHLAPSGDFKDNKFSRVMFTKGLCKGEGVAVNQIVETDFLTVVDEDGKEVTSSLYADGMKIFIKIEDKKIEIGKIEETNRGTELIPNEGMDFDSDGTKITLKLTW